MTHRRFSMCMNIEGFMRQNKYPDGYDVFQESDGTPLAPEEALAFLTTEKAKGRKVIPCSGRCGNPCDQPGCKGFDYSGGGCPGSLIDEEAA